MTDWEKSDEKPTLKLAGLLGSLDLDLLNGTIWAAYVHAVDAGRVGEHRHPRYCTDVLWPSD